MPNVLDNYTLAHVNKFLREIDARARRQRIDTIYNYRVAQAELKHYKEAIRKLEQQDRQIRAAQARAEGRRLDLTPSELELEALDHQQHVYVSDMTEGERARFMSERDAMWGTIPAHVREKSERLARGSQWN